MYSSRGRRLMVEYTCQRCQKKEYVFAQDAFADGRQLSNSKLPRVWNDICHYPGILCPECFSSLAEWMKEGVNNEAD